MRERSRWAAWLPALLVVLAAGCASPPRATPSDAAAGPWSGRLALQVKDSPSQSFAASFELKGNAQAGELTLSTPIGSTLAILAWEPGSATLRRNGETQRFESVEDLAARATGSAIPLAALFDWLRGIDTPVPGWRPDLSQLGQGRLAALRLEPPPETDLRVIFER
jgi:outer membrane lipoprotein LolB